MEFDAHFMLDLYRAARNFNGFHTEFRLLEARRPHVMTTAFPDFDCYGPGLPVKRQITAYFPGITAGPTR
jgi:hypothetical protein